jgi:phage terminase small subunit
MSNKITEKQKKFADAYVDNGGNRTEAALDVYDTKDYFTAANIGSENLKKPKIQEYLESIAGDAATRIEVLSKTAENETVRLNANKDILDRAGYKPTDKVDLSGKLSIDEILKELGGR